MGIYLILRNGHNRETVAKNKQIYITGTTRFGGRFSCIHYIYKHLTHFGVMPVYLRESEPEGLLCL